MSATHTPRITIASVDSSLPLEERKKLIADAGRRRHLSWGMDFDTRCLTLSMNIEDHWEPQVKQLWTENKASIKENLVNEFGAQFIEHKIENFIAIGTKPFSIVAHHTAFFHQVRHAFVMGYYYPALVGACALGERILNHMLLDLRDYFTDTPGYKRVFKKDSFDRWQVPIEALEAWDIFLPGVASEFRTLMDLRHRSVHFNPETYHTLRDDALAAILHMRTVIEQQFGTHGTQPWFILETKGQWFIKREYETHPFVKTYFLPTCPFLGPLFAIDFAPGIPVRTDFHDIADYGDGSWTDEEFAEQFNNRDPTMVVKPTYVA